MSENHAHTEGHDEHGGLSKGKIWKVFGILLAITVIEFIIALWVLPNHYMSHAVGNFVYIALTLLKAFYIVAYFMHLKYEKLGLQLSLTVTFIFIIYFLVLMLIEGGFLFHHTPNFLMKYFSIKKTLILVSILAIPGFLFYLLPQFAKNRYKTLPIFGDKIVAPTFHTVKGKKIPDTIYHTVQDFSLVNQDNETVNWVPLKDKIIILNLFYKSSPVKEINSNIQKDSRRISKNPLIRFLSISVDPSDNPSNLKPLANSLNAKPGKWDFLSGDTLQTYPFIRKSLLLDMIYHKQDGKQKFLYGNQILLIDNHRRIRGYYEATNAEALSKLDDEIKVLVAEDLRNIKDGR